MEITLASLARRVEELEAANVALARRLDRSRGRTLAFAFAGIAAIAFASTRTARAAGDDKALGASEFVLQDATGKARAKLALNKHDGPELQFIDAGGAVRMALGLGKDATTGLLMRDAKGAERLEIGLSKEGEMGIVLRDSETRTRLVIACEPDGTPAVVLRDAKGPRLVLYQTADTEAGLLLKDSAGGARAVFCSAAKTGIPALVLKAPDGTPRAALAVGEEGGAGIELQDAKGTKIFSKP